MAEISQIKLPSGTVYDIKDTIARQTAGGGLQFKGVTTTALTDGASTSTYSVGGENITAANGDLVVYGSKEFLFSTSDNKWHELGDNTALRDLAYQDTASATYTPAGTVSKPTFTGSSSNVTITSSANASGNYQPAGTVSQPTFTGSSTTFSGTFTPEGTVTVTTKTTSNKTATVSKANSGDATYTPEGSVSAPTISVATAGSTTTIANPTKQTVAKTVIAAAPGATAPANAITYYSVSGEVLSLYQLGYTTGDSITTTNVTVKNGDAAYTATAPTFTGTGARLVTGNIAVPATYEASFSGTEGDVSTSGTPNGGVSQPTFTGTKVQLSGITTASGTVSQPTFSGTQATITVS